MARPATMARERPTWTWKGQCITHLHRSSPAGLSDAGGEHLQGKGDGHGARFGFGVGVNHYVGQFDDLGDPSTILLAPGFDGYRGAATAATGPVRHRG